MIQDKTIANNLEKMRTKKGLTQEKVANFLGISRATYNNIESGKSDLSVSALQRLSALYGVSPRDFFDSPIDNHKFHQMYFYILDKFKNGIPKTKLAKLLYLADFGYFYDNLVPISNERYIHRQFGPVAEHFFDLTDSLYDSGKIDITPSNDTLLISSTSKDQKYDLLSKDERKIIDKICNLWHDKRTSEIVNFTHEQKPWKSCIDGEYIPYELIIQEDPDHVFAPCS